jgi:dephospho-CoA kinase
VRVADADIIAHEVMLPGGPAHQPVREAFGPGVLTADGRIDRKALASVVFRDPAALARLNALVHPAVRAVYQDWVKRETGLDHVTAVLIPLLYERGLERGWDAVIAVGSPPASVLERLRARGIGEEEAGLRLAAQWPVEEKMRRASHPLWNDGTLEQLKTRTLAVLHDILKKETSHG